MKLSILLVLCLLTSPIWALTPQSSKSIKQSISQSGSRDTNVSITVDWSKVLYKSKTEVSFQIVANPLTTPESPIFKQVFDSVERLDHVKHARFAAWFPYPKLGVAALDAPSGLSQCANVGMATFDQSVNQSINHAHLSCVKAGGPQGKITKIEYAFFGQSAGVCLNWANGTCSSQNVTEIVSKMCLGESECDIPVSTDLFGDPGCSGGPSSYRLAVQIQCNPPRNNTYWDFSLIDPMVDAFFSATDGRRPILTLSTTPNWLWTQSGGQSIHYYPDDWRQEDWGYNVGNELVDSTCQSIGQYYGRLISWYTRGGLIDEYGVFHPSSHRYDPSSFLVEILNEPGAEHTISPALYTCIYDASQHWIREWADPKHEIEFVGLALDNEDNLDYFTYFLNQSNHKSFNQSINQSINQSFETSLDWISYHRYASSNTRTNITQWETDFFSNYDTFFGTIRSIQSIRSRLSPSTKTTLNEVGVILPNDNDPSAVDYPRVYFNAVSALFAYMIGHVTALDIEVVGASQLVAYPALPGVMGGLESQVPSVAMMNWTTGERTARWHTVDLLSRAFTSGDLIVQSNSTSQSVYVCSFLAGERQDLRRMMIVNKLSINVQVTVQGSKGTFWRLIDEQTGEKPAKRIKANSDTMTLLPWTVAIINFDETSEIIADE